MADAMVERRPAARFFCHRCNLEFEDVLQDYTCPYCASGFIEQLDTASEGLPNPGDTNSDANTSIFEDLSDSDSPGGTRQNSPPGVNDLAFLMSAGRRVPPTGRRETLMEQLVYMISGARPPPGTISATASPFVLVGAPGDYVFGGEGLDAVVTQLLGQLDNSGPPPLPTEQLATLPSEEIVEGHAAAGTSCSVCWETFKIGESVNRLVCSHVFHGACITPWLQLHATCPVCRRSLLPAAAARGPRLRPRPPPRARPAGTTAAAGAAPGTGAGAGGGGARSARRPAPAALRMSAAAAAAAAQAATGAAFTIHRRAAPSAPSAPSAATPESTSSRSQSGSSGTSLSNSDWMSTSSTSVGSDRPPIERYNMDIDYD